MDLNMDVKDAENDPRRKQFTLCPECHQMAVEKRINGLGVLCCLGAWWICCLGVVFCLSSQLWKSMEESTDFNDPMHLLCQDVPQDVLTVRMKKQRSRSNKRCNLPEMMRTDFCNNCYKEKFLTKAHERRRLQLYMDDRSFCEPPIGAAEKPPQRRYILQPK